MFSLVIPVYKNEGSIPDLLRAIEKLHSQLQPFEAVFVVDGSPDRCYELLKKQLPQQSFPSQLLLLSRNFGSFAAIRQGLAAAKGNYFGVMAADLQEPPELIIEMAAQLRTTNYDVAIGEREQRDDPFMQRLPAQLFWGAYRRYVVSDMPIGGVDIFACNRAFRDQLLQLEERHSSLVAQVFWMGFRRISVPYHRQAREHGKSAWTFHKKVSYLMDSIFSFTDLPIRLLIRIGGMGSLLFGLIAIFILFARLTGSIYVPGYAALMVSISFLGSLNLLGLGIVGSYAWRTYENTKARPLAITLHSHQFEPRHE